MSKNTNINAEFAEQISIFDYIGSTDLAPPLPTPLPVCAPECEAYNRMKTSRTFLKDMISDTMADKSYHYSNEFDLIYKIVIGVSAKQYRKMNNISKNKDIGVRFTLEEMMLVDHLQRYDTFILPTTPKYKDRKAKLIEEAHLWRESGGCRSNKMQMGA